MSSPLPFHLVILKEVYVAQLCAGTDAWDEYADHMITSEAARSPEAWVGAPWNAATDIWSADILVCLQTSSLAPSSTAVTVGSSTICTDVPLVHL